MLSSTSEPQDWDVCSETGHYLLGVEISWRRGAKIADWKTGLDVGTGGHLIGTPAWEVCAYRSPPQETTTGNTMPKAQINAIFIYIPQFFYNIKLSHHNNKMANFPQDVVIFSHSNNNKQGVNYMIYRYGFRL